ncbi:multidrug effflux MFS transporter [Aliiglaciecola sp. LCG003]|uniref:multidrug effflux MFS transporter n=1 Tax=Aliiglaciecola sp. LCG003 TaxID=3053655 RepID=UPI0025741CEE|nr:multidrug effflux MFS transporter [Aliiglaciecola sp. LCG003]WJG09362.1 multidrug effflux MFS transporter [Aliiglaciecola sp. LCG003]
MSNTINSKIDKPELGLVEFVALMAFLTSLVALSIDAMLPAMNQIGSDLASDSPQYTHMIVSIFFLGMALGQMYYGPYSDAKGRRAAILSGLLIFALGTVICMLAESMEVLLFGRVVQAFGVSGPRIASIALIRDRFSGEAMARVMSFIMMVFILVPMIAPAFGKVILILASWREIFTSFLVIGSAVGIWFFSRQQETLPKNKRVKFSWAALIKSSQYILTHKQVMSYTLAMGFIFGAFLSYLSASQTLFEEFYQVGDMFPLYFAILAFSIGFASFVNGHLVMTLGMRKLCLGALYGNIVMASLLVSITWYFDGLPPLLVTVSLLFCEFFFIGILFGNLNSMAMVPLGHIAGLGAAIIGSLSSAFSVPIAIFIGSYVTNDIVPIAIGFLLFGCLALISVLWAGKGDSHLDEPEQVVCSTRKINQ